jgi:hypothetical protein
MPPQLSQLLALMVLAALGIAFSWTQGDQLLPAIFAAKGLVAATAAQRWLRNPP